MRAEIVRCDLVLYNTSAQHQAKYPRTALIVGAHGRRHKMGIPVVGDPSLPCWEHDHMTVFYGVPRMFAEGDCSFTVDSSLII
jgi:hypothetical protein